MSNDQAIAMETCRWLKANPGELQTPAHLFDVAWVKHKIVSIGESHYDEPHRDLVANMVKKWGQPAMGLALEITSNRQADLDGFLKSGGKLAEGWFVKESRYMEILKAARATETEVVAMDKARKIYREPGAKVGGVRPTLGPRIDRDGHMAASVLDLVREKSKVLILSGMQHARESKWSDRESTPPLGVRLDEALGKSVYTIATMTESGNNQDILYKTLKAEFGPKRKSLAFDVDRSPLARGKVVDGRFSIPWERYCDGMMVFFPA